MDNEYDLIIIGGGPMGLATAWQASHSAQKILVIDDKRYGHSLSSSVGATRQFRLQYEEEYMAELVKESQPYWRALSDAVGSELISDSGSLWFGNADSSSSEGQINAAMKTMDNLGIPYTELTKEQIEQDYHFTNLGENHIGFFQADGGSINIPETLFSLKTLNDASGKVTYLNDSPVLSITPGNTVTVTTAYASFQASKIVITAGAKTNDLIRSLDTCLDLEIWHMASCYFKKKTPEINYPTWYSFEDQADAPEYDPGVYYGFEEVSWNNQGYVRVAPAFAKLITYSMDTQNPAPAPSAEDIIVTEQFVTKHMLDLNPVAEFQTTGIIALPAEPTKKMFLDTIPGHDNIVVYCAGWGAKLIPLIGKICADLALTGSTEYDISQFTIDHMPKPYKKSLRTTRRLPF
ncbi:FAD-dependent oxidoreductase [Shewanella sp. D64]|uniref:FAD-dependent oxidoreductase n=1 Tax=unclassified Shewanella TaxID=196818 RepID=UPI0022BA59E1|nr:MULTISPECIES: FAD-dependent oxidoreductase [unclassified Shewanella]MEC4726636.1 FAD-dependent oxidoreductase [Shewanella sp. D64]MEC4739000.1 FAD-dependent oxidoreductase [Shewanella sp. E94]WBJ96853.1 FAD-dependent oxidoreductase [Shewanella sp. MTB7]